MGLDWNPIGRPKSGYETEFAQLFTLMRELPDDVGWLERVRRRIRGIKPDQIKKRWFEIQISPFETLQAPQVGRSPDATAWAKKRYLSLKEPKPSEAEFLREMEGYYVVALAPPCDGIPVYSNGTAGYVELFSFRAQFLNDIRSPNEFDESSPESKAHILFSAAKSRS
jgi:hypothetical protein